MGRRRLGARQPVACRLRRGRPRARHHRRADARDDRGDAVVRARHRVADVPVRAGAAHRHGAAATHLARRVFASRPVVVAGRTHRVPGIARAGVRTDRSRTSDRRASDCPRTAGADGGPGSLGGPAAVQHPGCGVGPRGPGCRVLRLRLPAAGGRTGAGGRSAARSRFRATGSVHRDRASLLRRAVAGLRRGLPRCRGATTVRCEPDRRRDAGRRGGPSMASTSGFQPRRGVRGRSRA